MLKKILLGGAVVLVLLIVGFVAVVAMQPAETHISRSLAMAAPADKIFEQVNNLHKSPDWSPFVKLDPQMKITYDGPESGEGAVYKWSGNSEAGEGSMTIVESKPNELVRMRLDFIRPMKDTSEAVFTFKPEGDKINVTWAMHGKNGFLKKAMCLFFDLDNMIGGMFSEGLTKMKEIVEAPTPAAKAAGPKPNPEGQESKDEGQKSKDETTKERE